ncbi:hypothetical protein NAI78_09860, partial [Francisella tularensis subsp. holarctica]|nr:hypothetical protein [Francisella tularensis subsp. holarctica]
IHKEHGFPIYTDNHTRKLRKFYKQIYNTDVPIDLKKKFLRALVGEYATLKRGNERKVGFLTNIYNCAGHYSLKHLDDASSAIFLFVELLSGR